MRPTNITANLSVGDLGEASNLPMVVRSSSW
jgi:hypothetical protein